MRAALESDNATQSTIVQNLVYGNTATQGLDAGIEADSDMFARNGNNFSLLLANNTVYGNTNPNDQTDHPAQGGEQGDLGGESNQVLSPYSLENNLFIATDQYGTVACSSTVSSPVTYRNSDAFYYGGAQPSQCGTPGQGDDLTVDPQFVNPAAGDFHTQRTSPVVGAGDINAPGLPPTDLDGKNRTVC